MPFLHQIKHGSITGFINCFLRFLLSFLSACLPERRPHQTSFLTKNISSQRHLTFFQGLHLGYCIVHLLFCTWLILERARKDSGCGERNAKTIIREEVTCRKKKKTFLEVQSPAAPLCSLSLLPASISHTHTYTLIFG